MPGPYNVTVFIVPVTHEINETQYVLVQTTNPTDEKHDVTLTLAFVCGFLRTPIPSFPLIEITASPMFLLAADRNRSNAHMRSEPLPPMLTPVLFPQ